MLRSSQEARLIHPSLRFLLSGGLLHSNYPLFGHLQWPMGDFLSKGVWVCSKALTVQVFGTTHKLVFVLDRIVIIVSDNSFGVPSRARTKVQYVVLDCGDGQTRIQFCRPKWLQDTLGRSSLPKGVFHQQTHSAGGNGNTQALIVA